MFQLDFGEVLEHTLPVLWELAHETRHVQVGIYSVAQCEVVGLSQNFDSVREGSLPTYGFLECGACSPATVYFSIEQTDVDQFASEGHHVGSHDFRGIGSGKAPNHIACCVSHVCTHAVVSQVNIVHEGFFEDRNEFIESSWQKQASSAEFSEGKTPSMPGRFSFRWSK